MTAFRMPLTPAALREVQVVVAAGLAAVILLHAPLLLGLSGVFVSLFAAAPLCVLALRYGNMAVLVAALLVWASIGLVQLAYADSGPYLFNMAALTAAVFVVLPGLAAAWTSARQEMRPYWPGVLTLLALFSGVGLWALLLQPQARDGVDVVLQQIAQAYEQSGLQSERFPAERWLPRFIDMLPAMVALSWFIGSALNIAVAQRILRRERAPTLRLASIQTPKIIVLAAVASAVLLALPSFPAAVWPLALMVVVSCCCALALDGLSCVIALARRYNSGAWVLLLVYVLLFMQPMLWLLLAMLGGVNSVTALRERFENLSSS